MHQSSPHTDEDQDSLFGSPPPSPARGRSPSQETFIAGKNIGPIVAVPSTGVGRKNVGTIALPGSHMSCAELPADLPASSLSLPRPTSSHHSPGITPHNISGTSTSVHTPVVTSRSSSHSVPSSASSATSNIPSPASTRKRRTSKAEFVTPTPSALPITLPGPNDPTPPNLLRSQSSLLGLAGLVGCVKPAHLYTHDPQPAPIQHSPSHSPIRGSTPAHPIVLDDDQDTPHNGKHPHSQLQIPQRLDQLNPEVLRSNIINSLMKEKNIFPVLESLIKLLGGEPHLPAANTPSQPFARPYGHGIFNASSPVAEVSTPGGPTTCVVSAPKRRKLKHVPAGAADWDVPFPFAAGEGPKTYRNTWAQDRAKQLVTQLLELVQNATKRAAIKTAKSGGKVSEGRIGARNSRSSRSASVETQIGQASSTRVIVPESLYTNPSTEGAATETTSDVTPMDNLEHSVGSSDLPSTPVPGSKDRIFVELEGAVEAGGSAAPCDYSAFEEWLSQLQQFVPLETNATTPGSDWVTRPSVPLDSSAPSPASNILVPMQHDASTAPLAIRDEAIDPILLAMFQQVGTTPHSQSPTLPTSTLAPGDIAQVLDISSTPPVFAHSPRTSLSSLTEPLTPLSDTDVPTSTIAHQDPVRGMHLHPFTTRCCTYKSCF